MVIGAIISGLVGQELVSETSKSIFHSITNILSHEHPVINSILSDLDIPAQIKLIRSIVTEVSENEIHNKDHNKTLTLSLEQLDDIVKIVSKQILIIKEGIAYHDTLWFNAWRTPDYETEIGQLKKQKNIMNQRLDNLIKVVQITNQLSKLNHQNSQN